MTQPDNSQAVQLSPEAHAGLHALQEDFNKILNELVAYSVQSKVTAPPQQAQYIPGRAHFAFSYFAEPLRQLFRWLYSSREDANFTYDLKESNKLYLQTIVSVITGVDAKTIRGYIDELNNDQVLQQHVRETTTRKGDGAMDPDARYGRRLGWYAIVRAMKPKVVIETGVEKGLGSCVLSAALIRNKNEGSPGSYFGTDIDPNAGYLYTGVYRDVGTILYGDSISSLEKFDQPIDVFINDSDHSDEYEAREYQTIKNKLSERAVILADNAHVTDKLCLFALETQRRFLFFAEKPANHWYPGAGIGFAFK